MPLTFPGVSATLAANLAATSISGVGGPQIAAGLAAGICAWAPTVVVTTVDAGSLGVGSGGPLPVLLYTPTVAAALGTGFGAYGLRGFSAPALLSALSNGLVSVFAQALIKTTHAGVGTGSGIATFHGPPAGPVLSSALRASGLVGTMVDALGLAVGQALDIVFAGLVVPIPVVGSGSPTVGSGVGVGQII